MITIKLYQQPKPYEIIIYKIYHYFLTTDRLDQVLILKKLRVRFACILLINISV